MLNLNHSVDVLTGGSYEGNLSWNSVRSEVDNCFKLYYITGGELVICGKDQPVLLENGGIYLINGFKIESYYCELSFSTDWLHFLPKDLLIRHALLAMPLVVRFDDPAITNLAGFLRGVDVLLSEKKDSFKAFYTHQLKIHAFIQLCISTLLDRYPWTPADDKHVIRLLEPAIHYMDKHFCEYLNLEVLAETCCLSPNYFHKLFSKTLCVTPANYILSLRMNEALLLILDNELSLKEISYRLGYCNDAYFSRVFKRYYGVTPGEYRSKRQHLLY